MQIKQAQELINKFDSDRGWQDRWDIKDLCLNINEEIGELWDLIKWIPEDEQRRAVKKKFDEVSDFVGDTLFLILKISNQLQVDASDALVNTLKEYDVRMPPEIMKKKKHANKSAGGHDNKNAQQRHSTNPQ